MPGFVDRFFQRYTLAELLTLTMLAALGIAAKPVVVPVVRMVARTLMVPAGALAGGFYMMWLTLGAALVRRRGAATIVALVQAFVVLVTGAIGSHGPLSLVTYVLPGVAADLTLLAVRHRGCCWLCCTLATAAASVCGVALANVVFYRLAWLPFAIALAVSAVSGVLGGIVAWIIAVRVRPLMHFGVTEEQRADEP